MKTKHMDLTCYSILLVAVAIVGIQLTTLGSVSAQEEVPIISAAQDGQNGIDGQNGNDGGARLPLSAEVADSASARDGVDGAGNGADGLGNGPDGVGGASGVGDGADGVGNGADGIDGADAFGLRLEANIP